MVCSHFALAGNSRGGRHLIWNGYTHHQNNKRDTWVSWKCIDSNCRATICTRNDVPSKIGQPHNHLPDHASVNSRKILESVRSRCRSETTPIPSIYDEEITKLRDAPWDAQTLETAQKLPTFESKISALYRTRQKLYPGIPNTRPRIQLEGKFRQTTSREPFLQGFYKLMMVTSTSYSYLQLLKIYDNCALQALYIVMELSTQHHQYRLEDYWLHALENTPQSDACTKLKARERV
ncbi:unnamed protein product [Mytilus coruscus]|uniref:FLYWCH-type domain-containing protein n=1 Tax=Mytilus coruscus TaxID=42192 RepID=A0A6J8ARW4_MYTCO|nr:unnamed protein product [Mytilus coruscus]